MAGMGRGEVEAAAVVVLGEVVQLWVRYGELTAHNASSLFVANNNN